MIGIALSLQIALSNIVILKALIGAQSNIVIQTWYIFPNVCLLQVHHHLSFL